MQRRDVRLLFPLRPLRPLRSNGTTNSNAHIFTKRLCLRLLKPSDAADIVRLLEHDSDAVQKLASMAEGARRATREFWQ